MPSYDDFVVFADESGDHGLETIDPEFPVFALAFCLFRQTSYSPTFSNAVDDLKQRHLGCTGVVLHERDIRKSRGPFKVLLNGAVREPFMDDLNRLVADADFTLVASTIRKHELIARYPCRTDNPYHIAVGFALERMAMHLRTMGCRGGSTEVVFECRGAREDAELRREFERVCGGHNAFARPLPFHMRMERKADNGAGLQLADLVARPIARKVLAPKQPNRAYDVLREKLRRDRNGNALGWGLKIFP
ncbi:MAG: hypothetical protein JWM27_2671 [Gemmatimonadetes bacterium]|nr:hypothetical protein [Gemmatimonadota bacterium]